MLLTQGRSPSLFPDPPDHSTRLLREAGQGWPRGRTGHYLARGPGELSVSQLHVQPELPLVDTAILPLLHAPNQLDVGPLQVLLPERALGLLFLLWGLREEPRERKGAGRGARCRTKVFRATKSREPHTVVLRPTTPKADWAAVPALQGGGTEAPGARCVLRVTQEEERAVSVQLSDKAEGCCALCRPGQPHCL